MADGWRPERQIEILAGTPPGGGLDRTTRTLLAVLHLQHPLHTPAAVVNVAGDRARKVWARADARAGDPHVLCIDSPDLTTDDLTGVAAFSHCSYTPPAILCNEHIAFATRSDSSYRNPGKSLSNCFY